jgi:signal transduction histidine kinase
VVAERDGTAEVAVEDSGPGIAPAVRGRLFEPFFTTKPRGTGLGLAVSRAIARAHGGELAAEAARDGGARFALRLPRGRAGEA